MLGHRRHHLAHAVAQHLAVVEVLVDDALGRPVERVAEQPGRVPGQRADLELDAADLGEVLGQRRADDADQAGRQAALGANTVSALVVGELADARGRRHVFGQVEVVQAAAWAASATPRLRSKGIALTTASAPDSAARSAARSRTSTVVVANGRSSRGAGVERGDLEAALVQQQRDQLADLAEADDAHRFDEARGHDSIMPRRPNCGVEAVRCVALLRAVW